MTVRVLAEDTFKHSPALGATLALLGVKGSVPLLHGAQGCTAAAKVKLVNHFLEAIPLATTAMDEVGTILGGEENIVEAIVNLAAKANPSLVGLCSTALTATRGDDLDGAVHQLRQHQPQLEDLAVAVVQVPDFIGGLQEGFAVAVESLLQTFAVAGTPIPGQITVLAGASLGPADIQELHDLLERFGFCALIVPDLSDSLDGHLDVSAELEESFRPISQGGITIEELRLAGRSEQLIAIGNSVLPAAQRLAARCEMPLTAIPQLMNLEACDQLVGHLARWSGRPVPQRDRRQRRQLLDALLDSHFYYGGKRFAVALESDRLDGMAAFLAMTGAELQVAITPQQGDLATLEDRCDGADLLVASSQAVDLAARAGIPLHRMGFPITDRLGQGVRLSIGYAGLVRLLIEIGNQLLEQELARSAARRRSDGLPGNNQRPEAVQNRNDRRGARVRPGRTER